MTLSTFGLTRLSNSRTVWQPHYARRVLITDAAAIVLAMLFAQWVRFGGAGYGPSASMLYTGYSLALACLWLGVLTLHHARSASILGCGIEEYRRVVAASFWTFGVIAIVALLARLEIARGYLALAFPLGTIGLLIGRKLWRRRVRARRHAGECLTSVLAIGDRDAIAVLATELMNDPGDGYVVVGAGIPGDPDARGDVIRIGDRVIPIFGDENDALGALGDRCAADTVALTDAEHFGVAGIQRLTWRLGRPTSTWWCRRACWTWPVRGWRCGRWPACRCCTWRSRSTTAPRVS